MIGVPIKTVLAEIDSTGTVEKGRRIAIRYVGADGYIRPMIVSKRVKDQQSRGGEKQAKKAPHMKDSFLIPIIDHTDGDKPKDLFAGGIIGYNPQGDIETFYPLTDGQPDK